jgi:hypothetical protein
MGYASINSIEQMPAWRGLDRMAANLDDSPASIALKGCRRGLQPFSRTAISAVPRTPSVTYVYAFNRHLSVCPVHGNLRYSAAGDGLLDVLRGDMRFSTATIYLAT